VRGNEGEATEKHLSATAAVLMVMEALPEFLATRVADLVCPGITLPKFTLFCPRERTRFEEACWPEILKMEFSPPQPLSNRKIAHSEIMLRALAKEVRSVVRFELEAPMAVAFV
jgi:hypothetical protein